MKCNFDILRFQSTALIKTFVLDTTTLAKAMIQNAVTSTVNRETDSKNTNKQGDENKKRAKVNRILPMCSVGMNRFVFKSTIHFCFIFKYGTVILRTQLYTYFFLYCIHWV